MLVSLVFASVVWFCFSEYKIKHQKKKKKDQNVEIGLLVWFGFAFWNRNFFKKKIVDICWSLQFLLVQFGLAFWNIKLTKTKIGQNVEIGLLVQFGFAFWNRKKKKRGNLLVSLVYANLVWSCFLEQKINQKKKIRMWKLVFQYIQFGFAFWNRIFF